MFRKKKESTAVLEPETQVISEVKKETINIPEPIIQHPEGNIPELGVSLETQKLYMEEAEKLGFKPSALIHSQLIQFCELEAIKIYRYSEVDKWLRYKIQEEPNKTFWCWRPLRNKDIMENKIWGVDGWGMGCKHGFYTSKSPYCTPYPNLVPLKTLNLVSKLENRFGDDIKFFVSDYSSEKPDPFIMALININDGGSKNCVIFDCWDEPGFGE
jgi:hypothetical protein